MVEVGILRIFYTLGLVVIQVISDRLLANSSRKPWIRAVMDTGTHGGIGALTWLIIEPATLASMRSLKRVITIAVLASIIDIDHFIAAKSILFADALAAPHRGIFHCSGILVLANLFLWCHHAEGSGALMFLLAWLPHHLRDATRRGIYFLPPQLSTPPLRPDLVGVLTVLLPWFVLLGKSKLAPLNQPLTSVINV